MLNFNYTALFQLISFLIFMWVLARLLVNPVSKMFAERQQRISAGLAAAEQSRLAAEQARKMIAQQIEQARHEAQEILRQAGKAADTMRENMLGQAKRDAEAVVQRAQAEIQRERQAAVEDLRREAGHLAVFAATRIIGKSMDNDTNRALVEQSLREFHANGV